MDVANPHIEFLRRSVVVESNAPGAVTEFAAFLITYRGTGPVLKWFARALGFSPSMSDTPPELLVAVGVAYHQLGERYAAARMFDKAISEGGDRIHRLIGERFAELGDHETAAEWFQDGARHRASTPVR